MPKNVIKRLLKNKRVTLFIILVVFGVVGITVLLISRAALPSSVSFESEIVQQSTDITLGDDSQASGGKYIEFLQTKFNSERLGVATGAWGAAWGPLGSNNSGVNAYMAKVASLGIKWVRTDFYTGSFNPSDGVYNFTAVDNVVNAAKANGLKVIATIAYAGNTWNWSTNIGNDHVAPKYPDKWAMAAGELARHYVQEPTVAALEIWNEPNIDTFWKTPDVAKYTALLCQSYTAIKAVNPTVKVITGGTAPAAGNGGGANYAPENFMAGIYSNGGKNCFDHVGHHPYDDAAINDDRYGFGASVRVHNVMAANGDGKDADNNWKKQVWATEVGVPVGRYGNTNFTEQEQADRTDGYIRRWWYETWGLEGWTGPWLQYKLYAWDELAGYGIIRSDGNNRPAADVIKNIATTRQ